MKIRADLALDGVERKVYLVAGPNEPDEHLAHKLAAVLLFWKDEPLVDATTKLPALAGWDFLPDLIALHDDGSPRLWVEVGSTTMHKLTKITRRAPRCRLVVLKETRRDAERLRRELDEGFDRPERVEILAWPDGAYKAWLGVVAEKTEAFGECDGRSLNAVVNGTPVVVEFVKL